MAAQPPLDPGAFRRGLLRSLLASQVRLEERARTGMESVYNILTRFEPWRETDTATQSPK